LLDFSRQVFAASRSEFVIPGPPIVVGSPPLTCYAASKQKPLERRVQRSLFDEQNIFGLLVDGIRNFEAMLPAVRGQGS
jgi:hypothetical protein